MLGVTAALRLIFPRDSIEVYRMWIDDNAAIAAALADADAWVAQPVPDNDQLRELSQTQAVQVMCPSLGFSGFHPDMVFAWCHPDMIYAWRNGLLFRGLNEYHSAIGLWAWRRGLDVPDAVRLFSGETFRRLGYYGAFRAEIEPLSDAFTKAGLDFSWFWLRAKRLGVFMHTVNHPRIDALVLLAKLVARELGMPSRVLQEPIERYVPDQLLPIVVWPVYPELASHLGVPGSDLFMYGSSTYRLEDFLAAQWEAYGDADPEIIRCPRITDGLFDSVLEPLMTELQ
jgi:hypothetical protein